MKTRKPFTSVSRRDFLKRSVAATGALAAPFVIPASVLGLDGGVAPSRRITLGAIGIGPRGQLVLGNMLAQPDMRFVAICDVRASRRQFVKNMADTKYGNTDCAMYRDLRELLARKDIDAVLIATGDRWHTLASMMAAKAGKDVYSEKPCGLTIGQCQVLDETMRHHARVFQAGTQRRSVANFHAAAMLARSGKLGKLHTLHASIYRPKVEFAWLPAEPEPPKEEIDWDMWLGPCPWRPYNKLYVAGRWRKHYDFDALGALLDWGAHTVDLCQWANDADNTMPLEYEPTDSCINARYPNGVKLVMDYLDTPFGDRSPQYHTKLGTCPVRFEGDEGWVETGDNGDFEVSSPALRAELQSVRKTSGLDGSGHARNFFDCIKTRSQTVANSVVMRRSHIACHAAAIAWYLGRKLRFDPVKEKFIGDDEANRMCHRAMREPWHI